MRFRAGQHLRHRREFEAVRQNPFRFQDGLFLFQAMKRTEGYLPRLGVVATKRLGNAVVRNRAKRLLRELFRTHQLELPMGTDLVLVARSKLILVSPQLRSERFLKACLTYCSWSKQIPLRLAKGARP